MGSPTELSAMATETAVAGFANPTVRYGRPTFDFAAAPSLFVSEDLRQEQFSLAHRDNINNALGQAEVFEAEAVAARRQSEADAAAAAAAAQAEEYRQMLASATAEQQRAQAEHASAAAASEQAAADARDAEFGAVTNRLKNDNMFAERRSLESQGHRNPFINSALAARGPYTSDGGYGGTGSHPAGYGPFAPGFGERGSAVQSRQRSGRYY